MKLRGSCQCGAVRFSVISRAPCPYQLCYCSICRKSAGSGGYAINLLADTATLKIEDAGSKRLFHAKMSRRGSPHLSSAERHFCGECGSPLWVFSPEWPDLLHPHASAIDTALPTPPERVHMMLGSQGTGWNLISAPRINVSTATPKNRS